MVSYSNGEDRGKMINESEGKNGTLGFSFKNSSKTSVQKVFYQCISLADLIYFAKLLMLLLFCALDSKMNENETGLR